MNKLSSRAAFGALMINRRNLYHLFSRLFQKEVDEGLLRSLADIHFPAHRAENALTEFRDALLRLQEYFEYDAGESLEDLAADYAKTFLGAGAAQGGAAFPYESVYTSPKRVMMQDAWSQMCEIFDSKGVERTEETAGLLEDHIALELDYMALLCDETSMCTETLAGLEEQRAFLNQHLLNWVPTFCLDLKQYADTEFYRMVGQLTTGFLQLDSFILDQMIVARKARTIEPQSFTLTRGGMDALLRDLQADYRVYAPKCLPERGMEETGGLVRYQEVATLDEIVNDRQSDFSPKEVVYPVSQTIFRFDENSCDETVQHDPKGIILIARPCDINGLKRLDNMFLANGGMSDVYYKRVRDRVKIFLLECPGSWDNCFCVSMGTNRTENYSAALRLGPDGVQVQVKDAEFIERFEGETPCDYAPAFVTENRRTVPLPEITPQHSLREIYTLPLWEECSRDCISCGGCNTVCPTCSCFDTVDCLNQENSRKGERRRVWSSCMLADFSRTAGGNIARKRPEQMMRFKTMHKVHDYKARFGGGDHMCVGCGRCIQRCPKEIDFADTITRLTDAVARLAGKE